MIAGAVRSRALDRWLLLHALSLWYDCPEQAEKELLMLVDSGTYVSGEAANYAYFFLLESYHQQGRDMDCARLLDAAQDHFCPEAPQYEEYLFFRAILAYNRGDLSCADHYFQEIRLHDAKLGLYTARVYYYLGMIALHRSCEGDQRDQHLSDATRWFDIAYTRWGYRPSLGGIFLANVLRGKLVYRQEFFSTFVSLSPEMISLGYDLEQWIGSNTASMRGGRYASDVSGVWCNERATVEDVYSCSCRVQRLECNARERELRHLFRLYASAWTDCLQQRYSLDPHMQRAIQFLCAEYVGQDSLHPINDQEALILAMKHDVSSQTLTLYDVQDRYDMSQNRMLAQLWENYEQGTLDDIACDQFHRQFPYTSARVWVYYLQGCSSDLANRTAYLYQALDMMKDVNFPVRKTLQWAALYYDIHLELGYALLELREFVGAQTIFERLYHEWTHHIWLVSLQNTKHTRYHIGQIYEGLLRSYQLSGQHDKMLQLADILVDRMMEESRHLQEIPKILSTLQIMQHHMLK